jgi:D-alanyl-D-alanine carboxypeptidase
MPLERVDGHQLQSSAHKPWLDLKAAAKAEGLTIGLVSGFRSPEDQRQIFLNAVGGYGATAGSIAAGQSDHAVNGVLQTISVPGYSRHHTGYTIDISCAGGSLEAFGNSPCFQWISRNNYENAKKYGWIPSYPNGAGLQGPNPEPWEYVWVGTDVLYVGSNTSVGG